jgi:hypothetical protein
MKADYSPLNPALDPQIVPLFPFPPHLWAFMRLVLFHPDYAPHIPREDQIKLAEFILSSFKNHVLTVGDIYYYTALFVEKRNPSPPRITRSQLLQKPKAEPIFDLFDNSIATTIAETLKENEDPEINSQRASTALYDVFEACAPPKQTDTIQALWERSTSGTIGNQQLRNDVARGAKHAALDGAKWGNSSRKDNAAEMDADAILGGLFEDTPAEKEISADIFESAAPQAPGENTHDMGALPEPELCGAEDYKSADIPARKLTLKERLQNLARKGK